MAESTRFDEAAAQVRAGADPREAAAALLQELTPEERLSLLDGDEPFWQGFRRMVVEGYNHTPYVHGAVPRLGIPGLRFGDGPRGVVLGQATAFPVSMARGATWDPSLEERVGTAIGRELRALGGNFFGGICINLPRHPAWGRIQETYGEDPLLLGDFGAALHRGVAPNAMTTVKHYALNSMENARFTVDVTIDEASLQEVFLPHFRRVVEAGADAVMTAYNSVNGAWAGENRHLITEVLREQWGFRGIAVSDFIWGLRDPIASLRAGLDVEEPFSEQRAPVLPEAVAADPDLRSEADAAAIRILAVELAFAARRVSDEPGPSVVFSAEHRALAREVATRSMVLLKNAPVEGAPVLPLETGALRRLAVIGDLAARPNTGDNGSSDVRSPAVSTPLDGLRAGLAGVEVTAAGDDPQQAAMVAADADAAVVVVGYTAQDEGEYIEAGAFLAPDLVATYPPTEGDAWAEDFLGSAGGQAGAGGIVGGAAGGDRRSLRLHRHHVELIEAVAAANPRTVVVIVAAGAVITEEWRERVPAVLLGWYAGSEGGAALADVLTGAVDVAGRLPFSIPRSEDDLPFFDPDATSITYDRWFGQRLLDRDGVDAAFPLGFGLSYTRFAIADLELGPVDGEHFAARATVTNTGDRDGRHVVQLYAEPHEAAGDFPRRVLVGFAGVEVPAGGSRTVELRGSVRPLQRWTDEGFVPAAAEALVAAGADAADRTGPTARLRLR
ncbi:glycoside hydrolase family 3 C-terminal domain-containing protein [Amnibacterium sp. CER49]|uniref:beta-glucosidase family protein n=1 Tax=Amnibacterium sp. CER49 TaxID=3039161 RepID=UPI00244A8C58|nr:glycoside hydrolase family 3 C-terminal domain-containing protein [Amnibacterium sp. CER49]MDH2445462.1 glycoside hydrolase family 3 C-terminal domain-containing protein [Amnibacterium sp. CER49]